MNNRMQKTINGGLYEILELNVSEPIVFQGDMRNQQHTYNEKNKQVILVVPKQVETTML
ncbi:MAG: hypothetical protein ACJ73C_09590 [Nitrososphaeraceae archaeon]